MVFDRSHRDVLAGPRRPIPPQHCAEQHLFVARLHEFHRVQFLTPACNWQWWERGQFKGGIPRDAIAHFSGLRPMKTSAERLEVMREAARALAPAEYAGGDAPSHVGAAPAPVPSLRAGAAGG